MTLPNHVFWTYFLFRKKKQKWWAIAGSVLPDIPYVIPLAAGGLTGALDIWQYWWAHPVTKTLHSFPIVGSALILSLALERYRAAALLGGILFHAFFDMWTHVADAYPILYPFSDFRFPTPISYWETSHHAFTLRLINGLLVAAALLCLWRERRSLVERSRHSVSTRADSRRSAIGRIDSR